MVSRIPMLDANSKIPDRFLPDAYASTPVATIIEYAGSTVPTDYLLCDGSAVSRTAYPELFAIIGTTYGVGDGSTTFNVPNRKGRVGVGLDASQTEFDVLGETGGAKTHTLTSAEIPAHTHSIRSAVMTVGVAVVQTGAADGAVSNRYHLGNGTADLSAIANTGGGGAHNNLQPYITLNYAIKFRLGLPRGSYDKRMVGEVSQWAGVTPPAGYLACDGSAVSRAAYPELFAAIGTTYGAGDGSTTFNLPNSPAGTVVSAIGTTAQTGTTATPLIYTGMILTLPAGTWELEGGINSQSSVLDAQAVAIYNVTAGAEVPNTRADVLVQGAPPAAGGNRSRTIVVTLGVTTQFRMMVIPNGSSVPSVVAQAAGVASVPSAWLDARRQPFNLAKSIINASPVPLLSSLPANTQGIRQIGEMYPWAGTGLPTGTLECNGQLVSRTTFADLFAALGTTYGVGDGSTTFALPDLRGRTVVGVDASQTEFDVLGETGGAKTHTLTTAQMPTHSHLTGISSTASYGSGPAGGATAQVSFSQNVTPTSDAGSGAPHNNLQPYMALRWVIKALWLATEVSVNAAHTHRVMNLDGIAYGTAAAPTGQPDGTLYVKYTP